MFRWVFLAGLLVASAPAYATCNGNTVVVGCTSVDGTSLTISGGVMSATAGTGSTGANPTATAGPAAVNGSASTFMRSDGAPLIQKGSSSQFGIVEVDNATITAASGVLSAAATTISGTSCTPGGSCTLSSSGLTNNPIPWTPTFTTTGTAGTPSYNTNGQVGSYAVSGKSYDFDFYLSASAWAGSPTGFFRVGGLPITSAAGFTNFGECYITSIRGITLDAGFTWVSATITPGNTVIDIAENGSNQTSIGIGMANVATGATLVLAGHCHVFST